MEIEHHLDRPPLTIVDWKNSALHLHVTIFFFQIHVAWGQFLEKAQFTVGQKVILSWGFNLKKMNFSLGIEQIQTRVMLQSSRSWSKSPWNSEFCFRLKGNESMYSWTEGEVPTWPFGSLFRNIYQSSVFVLCVWMCRISPACLPSLGDNSLREAAVLLTPTCSYRAKPNTPATREPQPFYMQTFVLRLYTHIKSGG